jgi:hypothetical protein
MRDSRVREHWRDGAISGSMFPLLIVNYLLINCQLKKTHAGGEAGGGGGRGEGRGRRGGGGGAGGGAARAHARAFYLRYLTSVNGD